MNSDGTSIEPYSSDDNNPNISKNVPPDVNAFENDKAIDHRPLDIRENYVTKATEFLNAETIRNTPYDRKLNFLKSKGLTDQEIQVAFNRISGVNLPNQQYNYANQFQPYYNSTLSNGTLQKSYETQGWFRRLFGPIAFASAIIYIGYHIYKKYIEGWLFGTQKPTVEERLKMIELSVQKCELLLEKKIVESEDHISKQRTYNQIEYDFIKQELKSLKSLLLSRNQFPPATGTPSLPDWQQAKQIKLKNDKPKYSDYLNKLRNGNISEDKSEKENHSTSTKQNQTSSNTNKCNSLPAEDVNNSETVGVSKNQED